MKRILQALWKAYSMGARVLVGAICIGLAALLATGRLTMDRVRALERAALETSAPAGAPARKQSPAAGARFAPGGGGEPGSAAPPEILKEIQRAAEDLRIWEDRIDLLGGDLVRTLASVGEKDQTNQEIQGGLARLKKELVPLLNDLFSEVPGFRPFTEENLWPALLGGEAGGTGLTVLEELRRLRQREASLSDSIRSLRALAPEDLAGILVAGLKPGAPGAISEEQALRVLSAMEPARLARVFKSVREEDPRQAAVLMALVLSAPGGSPGPEPRGPAAGRANGESDRLVGGEEKRG